jgi:hypothetical protein
VDHVESYFHTPSKKDDTYTEGLFTAERFLRTVNALANDGTAIQADNGVNGSCDGTDKATESESVEQRRDHGGVALFKQQGILNIDSTSQKKDHEFTGTVWLQQLGGDVPQMAGRGVAGGVAAAETRTARGIKARTRANIVRDESSELLMRADKRDGQFDLLDKLDLPAFLYLGNTETPDCPFNVGIRFP